LADRLDPAARSAVLQRQKGLYGDAEGVVVCQRVLYREVDELRREATRAFEVTDPERYGAAGPCERAAQRHIVLQFTPFLDCSQTGLSGLLRVAL